MAATKPNTQKKKAQTPFSCHLVLKILFRGIAEIGGVIHAAVENIIDKNIISVDKINYKKMLFYDYFAIFVRQFKRYLPNRVLKRIFI